MTSGPRCGKPMRRYERTGGPPALEDPSCGRPSGHGGVCRSREALARYALASRLDGGVKNRQRAARRRTRQVHADLSALIAAALEAHAASRQSNGAATRKAAA